MSKLTHVSLFTGIGGADLAAEWAGFETVLQVERDDYCRRVLEKHWPDVPRITDVREVHDDERWTEPTVISGGFPCQPFSAAGKRRGADDDRYLWPELLRIVEELRPAWVVGENVSGLLSIRDGMEIDDMLASLEARNYTPWILHYPAASVGAPHKRDRVFIVAHTEHSGRDRRAGQFRARRRGESENGSQWESESDVCRVAPKLSEGVDGGIDVDQRRIPISVAACRRTHWDAGEWTGVPRVATGVKHRVDRLKALGNAIVPQQIYPIFLAIAEVDS